VVKRREKGGGPGMRGSQQRGYPASSGRYFRDGKRMYENAGTCQRGFPLRGGVVSPDGGASLQSQYINYGPQSYPSSHNACVSVSVR
jgi:hypothetical protein